MDSSGRSSAALTVVEICAGAGGQSLGIHRAGFAHRVAIELDVLAAETLRSNLQIQVEVGDVADPTVWNPADFDGVDLLAGGVPCPPFSVAGQQLGASDERDLFAWAIEQVQVVQPRAVMLENVRGLAGPRFSAYRQRVLDRLANIGYTGAWKLLNSSDYGVPQLRPRFVLVAMREEEFTYFRWPTPRTDETTVGDALLSYMSAGGWAHAAEWSRLANRVGPTLVGGSKKHGGADLGPTRAKEAWRKLYVDGRGIAESPPNATAPSAKVTLPRLTIEMAARLQGWLPEDEWIFAGRKTAQYRQIGNAFPPPVAEAIGAQIRDALNHVGEPSEAVAGVQGLHDPVYRALSTAGRPLTMAELLRSERADDKAVVERKIADLGKDFVLDILEGGDGVVRYRLGEFKGFTGQSDHARTDYIAKHRRRVS